MIWRRHQDSNLGLILRRNLFYPAELWRLRFCGGPGRNRNGIQGFAVLCITTLPPGRARRITDLCPKRKPNILIKKPLIENKRCNLVDARRLELPTPSMSRRYSNQLSYASVQGEIITDIFFIAIKIIIARIFP